MSRGFSAPGSRALSFAKRFALAIFLDGSRLTVVGRSTHDVAVCEYSLWSYATIVTVISIRADGGAFNNWADTGDICSTGAYY
jgi:hypothetical protein